MAGWGDVPTGSKNNGLNQPKAPELAPCIAHVIKKRVESRALQANSSDNLNKGYCKLGQVNGDYSGRKRANSYAPPDTHVRCATCHKSVDRPWPRRPCIHGGTGVCKAWFQGVASPCSRSPIASFMLPGLTHTVRLHPV